MKSSVNIVVGLGYGDEGKGLTTDYLVQKSKIPLVVRFNGGQQAGHTVLTSNGLRHVFSNFGSGTLRGAPTYWSKYCTFSAGSMLNEYDELIKKGVSPILYVDNLSPVTTHYDSLFNKLLEESRGVFRHGSCGMGFGVTIERHFNTPYRFFAQDLIYPEIARHRLKQCREYYRNKATSLNISNFDQYDHEAEDNRFIAAIRRIDELRIKGDVKFIAEKQIFSDSMPWTDFIFEGAQGVLLDMDFGFFPHVTRSNTTSKNALSIINEQLNGRILSPEVYYVSRIYQTRHGEGPFASEGYKMNLVNNENETNVFNQFQGNFRVGPLNIDLLQYALMADSNFSYGLSKNFIVTCLDQVDSKNLAYFQNNEIKVANSISVIKSIGYKFDQVLLSSSACSEAMLAGTLV